MGRQGIVTATDISKGVFDYDSRIKKTTVDLDQLPAHADVLDMNGGTVITTTANQSFSEVLLKIDHNLGFVPKILAFMYVYEVPTDGRIVSAAVGTYQQTDLYLVANAFGYGEEHVVVSADTRSMYVKHTVESFVGGIGGTYNGVGSYCKFKLRYLITNLPDVNFM